MHFIDEIRERQRGTEGRRRNERQLGRQGGIMSWRGHKRKSDQKVSAK